jgi:hypothetical protein
MLRLSVENLHVQAGSIEPLVATTTATHAWAISWTHAWAISWVLVTIDDPRFTNIASINTKLLLF